MSETQERPQSSQEIRVELAKAKATLEEWRTRHVELLDEITKVQGDIYQIETLIRTFNNALARAQMRKQIEKAPRVRVREKYSSKVTEFAFGKKTPKRIYLTRLDAWCYDSYLTRLDACDSYWNLDGTSSYWGTIDPEDLQKILSGEINGSAKS